MSALETTAVIQPKLKQVVRINNASMGPDHYSNKIVLFGVPENHPNSYLNGKNIHSSEILSIRGDRVETKNTIYMVQNWISRLTAN